jgi:TM2 domain-containing membrane protein YozV
MPHVGTSELIVCLGLLVPIGVVVLLVHLLNQAKASEATHKEEMVRLISTLPQESQTAFMISFTSQRKTPSTAVLLAVLLGGLGAHKFYLGQTGMGIMYLLFCWTGIPALVALIEAFTITAQVNRINTEIAREAVGMLGGQPIYPRL